MARPAKRPIDAVELTTALRPGDMLKAMRDLLGLSQENFAAKLGVNRQQISAYETGDHSPYMSTLADIAEKAGLDVEVVIRVRRRPPAPASEPSPD